MDGIVNDPVRAADRADGLLAVLSLLQDLDDLLRRKLADLHRCPPIPRKTLTYQPASFQGSHQWPLWTPFNRHAKKVL